MHELASGSDDTLRHVALQGLGFEGLSDVGEALCCLGVDGRIGSEESLVIVGEDMETWTYCSISSARKE